MVHVVSLSVALVDGHCRANAPTRYFLDRRLERSKQLLQFRLLPFDEVQLRLQAVLVFLRTKHYNNWHQGQLLIAVCPDIWTTIIKTVK